MSGPSLGGGLLGQLAVARGLVTPEQLRSCLEIASRAGPGRPLGAILVSQGLLSAAQLQALLTEQAAMPATPPLGGAGKRKKNGGKAPDELDLDLSLEDAGEFEIEQSGESRVIANEEARAAPVAAPAPAPTPAPAPVAAGPVPVVSGTVKPTPPQPITAVPVSAPSTSAAGAKQLAELVVFATRAFASDLHLHPGHPVTIRQHGRLVPGSGQPLAASTLEPALRELLSAAERERLDRTGETDATLVVGALRCRAHLFRDAGGLSAVVRVAPAAPPTLQQLGLPTTLARFVTGQGLVLLAGSSGSGKTWTLAALVDLLNGERQDHIVCIERPIEFVHASKRCVVTQREVPTHAASVARAVGAALHEDPDVLVIGEIEDAETARLALQAAEGGRLVLATFPAQSVARAVARLLGLFPADQQSMAGAMLSGALRAVVAQRLVLAADNARRVPICEIVDVDAATSALIAQGNASAIQPTVTIDQALSAAVRGGLITRDEARKHADRTEAF